MSEETPIRPGYNRDVPMTVETNQQDEVVTVSVQWSAPVVAAATASVLLALALVLPVIIKLWGWAL